MSGHAGSAILPAFTSRSRTCRKGRKGQPFHLLFVIDLADGPPLVLVRLLWFGRDVGPPLLVAPPGYSARQAELPGVLSRLLPWLPVPPLLRRRALSVPLPAVPFPLHPVQ